MTCPAGCSCGLDRGCPGYFLDTADRITNPGALDRITTRTRETRRTIDALRATLAVEHARAWEEKGLEWSGALSVSAAEIEASLAWIRAVTHIVGLT